MGLNIFNFRESVLDGGVDQIGEVDVDSNSRVSAEMLAPGVIKFTSENPGKRRLDSAGVHGDEVDGQKAVCDVVDDLIAGRIRMNSGEWIACLASIEAIRAGVRGLGYNLNRLFGPHARGKAAGTYERARADELQAIFGVFAPDFHSDWHGTIQPADFPFAVSSVSREMMNDPRYRSYLADFAGSFAVPHTIVRPIDDDSRYTTLEFAATDRMLRGGRLPRAETVELGQIGTDLSDRMVDAISHGLRVALWRGFDLSAPSAAFDNEDCEQDHTTWVIDRQLVKASEAFRFELPRLANFMELEEGQLIATDGRVEHRAEEGQVLVFPHPDATLGEQVGFLVSKE